MSKVFFSGIQSSCRSIHLGNYIGALLNWEKNIKNFKDDNFIFMVADLHAMTTIHNPNLMRDNIKNLLSTYIACGINPIEKNNVHFFIQSKIPAHCELNWILTTICPLGLLERMTQFKDKKGKLSPDEINTGLLCYPILMASDILLYQANYVPVGEDQKQHVEFCRDIVLKFNNIFKVNNVFTMPECYIDKISKRIMSLSDGTKKMSKSSANDNDKILLTDTDDIIAKKIKIAKTDSIMGIFYDTNRPEVSNLITIYSAISGKEIEEISNIYREKSTKIFKDDLTQIVIDKISPIRKKIEENLKNYNDIEKLVKIGNEYANDIANDTLSKVKNVVGLQ